MAAVVPNFFTDFHQGPPRTICQWPRRPLHKWPLLKSVPDPNHTGRIWLVFTRAIGDGMFTVAMRSNRERKCADTIGTMPVPGLAFSSAKILIYFSNKIHGSNFIKQHSETVTVRN